MSEMQASVSAHAIKSAIRVSYPTTEVLCCHFPGLDESSLVPLTSILNITWKSISQSLWLWSYHLALHLLLVPSSLLYPVLKLLVRYLTLSVLFHLLPKFLVSCLHNANLSHLFVTLSNSNLYPLLYILCFTSFQPGKSLCCLNKFSVLHCFFNLPSINRQSCKMSISDISVRT